MNALFSALAVLGQLLKRWLDQLEQDDKARKKIRREDRRRDINENPDPVWRDTFGAPSGRMRVSEESGTDVRHHSTATRVEGNQQPRPRDIDQERSR